MVVLAYTLFHVAAGEPATSPGPPQSRRDDFAEVLHGVRIPNPYRWPEDQNSPEAREWIEQQNRYTHSLLDSLPFGAAIRARLADLMRIDRLIAPKERNGRSFFWSKRADDDLWILKVRYGLEGEIMYSSIPTV